MSAGIDSAPSVLSRRKTTWARPNWDFPPFSAPFVPEPAKITSCMEPPRRVFAPCSPITQASASIIFDFPEPLGPTTALMPGANSNVVDDAKDLKPRRVSEVRCTDCLSSGGNRAGVLAGAESSSIVLRCIISVPGVKRAHPDFKDAQRTLPGFRKVCILNCREASASS